MFCVGSSRLFGWHGFLPETSLPANVSESPFLLVPCMPEPAVDPLSLLRADVPAFVGRALVPYSGRPVATVLLLSDGTRVPGVRVESASFSLVIPALLNAWTTAVSAGRRDVVAAVQSEPFTAGERAFIADWPGPVLGTCGADAAWLDDGAQLPTPGPLLDPFLPAPALATGPEGIAAARRVAHRALTPASDFPVGCVLALDDGRGIPGVNVEHSDWSHILCAERTALGTAVTWGLTAHLQTLYLTCLRDTHASPCGACRQLLAELAPGVSIWIDRGAAPPEMTSPERLLPGSFRGQALLRNL